MRLYSWQNIILVESLAKHLDSFSKKILTLYQLHVMGLLNFPKVLFTVEKLEFWTVSSSTETENIYEATFCAKINYWA